MTTENQIPETFNETEWTQKEYANALAYCSKNGLTVSNLLQPESAILPPVVAIWLVEVKENTQRYWVITGDLPNDHIPSASAKNPREAIKNFSLRWQLKAENIMLGQNQNQNKQTADEIEKLTEFADLLISSANNLYEIAGKEEFWKSN